MLFAHLGLPPLPASWAEAPGGLPRLLRGLHGCLANGPAAVVVFFVISGLCIHLAHRDLARVPFTSFCIRRGLRILVPMACAAGIAATIEGGLQILDAVLWSLYCELAYYLLYPLLLLPLARRFGWLPLVVASLAVSLGLIASHPGRPEVNAFDLRVAWLVGLPCWLFGCVLAERLPTAPPSARRIWAWRGGLWALSVVFMVLRFHAHIGHPWTMHPFAALAACWLGLEIAWCRVREPPRWLEAAGSWSYSLYLIHPLCWLLADRWLGALDRLGPWTLAVAGCFAGSFVFHLAVERPAHRLARRLGGRPRAAVAPVAAAA